MNETKTILCPVCGMPLPEKKPGSRGRPQEYHPDCRKLEQLFSWTEDTIMKINAVTAEKKKGLRGRLWYLANLMNAVEVKEIPCKK